VEANITALLCHFYAVLWSRRRDCWPDRSDMAARAMVARLAHHAAWAVCDLLASRRVSGATLRIERGAQR